MDRNKIELVVFYIYVLIDPISNEIRYVGKTKNIKDRLYEHCQCDSTNSDKNNWIQSLISKGYHPIISIIDEANGRKNALNKENTYINKFKKIHPLLNIYVPIDSRCNVKDSNTFISESEILKNRKERGKYYKSLRLSKHLTRRKLSILSGLHAGTIKNIETGITGYNIDGALIFCEFLKNYKN